MPCRIDWHPSRWLVAALCVLALAAAGSVLASGLPSPFKPMIAGIALLAGLGQARREALRPALAVSWTGTRLLVRDRCGEVRVLHRPALREQGPLLRVEAFTPGGRRWSRTWWPDTIPSSQRRRLRLAAAVSPRSGIHLPSMAA